VEQRRAPDGARTDARQAELSARVRRFASLRGAQRALGRAVHPSELEQANRVGRSILIALEGIKGQGGGFRGVLPGPAALARVDEMLDEATGHVREIIHRIAIPELRSALQDLSGERLVEAQGLIDLLLDAGVPEDAGLRMLEYLITLAASEDRHGRRVVVRDPAKLSSRLREVCAEMAEGGGRGDPIEAERIISSASLMLHAEEDLGAVRDRMRDLKDEIGNGIFHPRVLAASVAYNVAMWNRVADLLEGSRSIDLLANDLFAEASEAPAGKEESGAVAEERAARELLATKGFARLVRAVGARLRGGSTDDLAADRCAVAASREALRPAEVEVFDRSAEGDEIAELSRSAIVVGLVLRNAAALQDPLLELGLDPKRLRVEAAAGLADELANSSRKLFEEGRHQSAFLLSEVRSRHLADLLGEGGGGSRASASAARSSSDLAGLLSGRRAGALAALLTVFGLAFVVSGLFTSGHRSDASSRAELAALSPFLDSGYVNTLGETQEFVGGVTAAWDYLSPEQRLRVVAEIGTRLRDQGVQGAVLKDRFNRVHARFARGKPQLLDPGAAGRGAP